MKYSTSRLTPFPPTFPRKIVCNRIESAGNCARAPALPLSTFKINTSKSVSKQRTLTPSRMNTYAKTGEGWGCCSRSVVVAAVLYARLASVASAPRSYPHSIRFESICYPFVFTNLQNPHRASPLYSHPYKTPGVPPPYPPLSTVDSPPARAARAQNGRHGVR
jgi:hypothetical protein